MPVPTIYEDLMTLLQLSHGLPMKLEVDTGLGGEAQRQNGQDPENGVGRGYIVPAGSQTHLGLEASRAVERGLAGGAGGSRGPGQVLPLGWACLRAEKPSAQKGRSSLLG